MKHTIIIILLLAINIATPLWVLPYAQDCANSHFAGNDLFVILYFILGGSLLLYALYYNGKRGYQLLLVLMTLFLFYWGYRISIIACTGCVA